MAGHEGSAGAGAAVARRSGWRRGDLEAQPFPDVPGTAAADPDVQRETLAGLRAWAEQDAEAAIAWYLKDKRLKRVGSRLLQGLAITFAVAGTAVPLGTAAYGGSGQGWGYVLLAVAAGCKAFDHFFGVSAAWMRDIVVAHALRTELNAVRLEWAADVLRSGPGADRPGRLLEPAEVERQLALIQRLAGAVRSHVDGETAEWQAEFRSSTRQLQGQGGALPAADR
ncbi:SLATT domain-containing protein [Streptomyces cocklensis]|uniref:SLATT_2 domain-containing protein n=1 Tax=Actinacidiphila cocklensis TaxID=887465 RepID=A0A9W4DRC4_9ACTN|nr:SLATT domain-containing protein [Actinacidiphila cocklensis]MDD1061782.1 SLATT domain-containing protein [Actinacidiphila cocklensis]CAG6396252.1 SLATT_2 domain-containing protein [Actinacidiphila cocklensis]